MAIDHSERVRTSCNHATRLQLANVRWVPDTRGIAVSIRGARIRGSWTDYLFLQVPVVMRVTIKARQALHAFLWYIEANVHILSDSVCVARLGDRLTSQHSNKCGQPNLRANELLLRKSSQQPNMKLRSWEANHDSLQPNPLH
eukprot:SAG31_NODE_4166_length_3518_cov_2.348055_5_plen_143_part_00